MQSCNLIWLNTGKEIVLKSLIYNNYVPTIFTGMEYRKEKKWQKFNFRTLKGLSKEN